MLVMRCGLLIQLADFVLFGFLDARHLLLGSFLGSALPIRFGAPVEVPAVRPLVLSRVFWKIVLNAHQVAHIEEVSIFRIGALF